MPPAILSAPFRPFFLAAAAYGLLSVALWALWWWSGNGAPGLLPDPLLWHGHAMMTGFAGAIIAGFLLTAAGNWTGMRTANATVLGVLVLAWLAGRLATFWPQVPAWAGLAGDTAFWGLTWVLLLRVVLLARNWRNLGFACLPLAFLAVDLAWHLERTGVASDTARPALWAGIDLLTLIMGAMGGRVIPFFTGRRLPDARIRNPAWRAWLGNGLLVAVVLANLVAGGTMTAAAPMLAAGIFLLVRLSGWDGLRTRGEPMLWILHLGYAWLGAGLILRAVAAGGGALAESTVMHAITVGGLGSLGLGMITRVALGHTGRPIAAPAPLTVAFCLVNLAALARLAVVVGAPALGSYVVSAGLWSASMALYLWHFTPLMFRPRLA